MIATTRAGKLEGLDLDGVTAYLGIPYAAAARWHRPEPVTAWTGARAATRLAPGPPQPATALPAAAALPGTDVEATAEDCLYLNVWAPDGVTSAPVMVWLPGGAFISGSASLPLYDGARLATGQQVVVVTVTYRVGVLGFAAVPECPPNRGLLDQVAALEWVRESIDVFGGDPGNVTVFGESAGAGSILHLMAMPSARGLFQRAIVQSGATDHTLTVDQAASVTTRFLDALRGDLSAPVERILAAQADTIVTAMADVGPMPLHPFVDGELVTTRPVAAMGDVDVDLLIGTTRDEMRMFLDPASASLDRDRVIRRTARYLASLGAADVAAESLVSRYDDDPHLPTPGDMWSAIQTDGEMRRPADAVAAAHLASGRATFVYRFDEPLSGRLAHLGACHASDLPYPFGAVDCCGWPDVLGPGASALADAMQSAWAAFARNGDPSCDELGHWPHHDAAHRATMLLADKPELVDDPAGDRRRSWTEIAPVSGS